MKATSLPSASNSLDVYYAGIGRIPLLTFEAEQSLARAYRRKGDARAAHRLVTANLRFVVKIANEYRSYGPNIADLVQEGNIGLVKAVQKFDPDRGVRLISYAVWWIRAYIQNHILRSFSLVKLGTTQAQRKLFFSLARARRELDRSSEGADSDADIVSKIAKKLGVKPTEVEEMTQRMLGRDVSLHAPVGDGGDCLRIDFLASDRPRLDDAVSAEQQQQLTQSGIATALARLDERERYIIEQRFMRDEQMTLKELGRYFGFSRERARQLELRAKQKLKKELHALAVEIDWPLAAA